MSATPPPSQLPGPAALPIPTLGSRVLYTFYNVNPFYVSPDDDLKLTVQDISVMRPSNMNDPHFTLHVKCDLNSVLAKYKFHRQNDVGQVTTSGEQEMWEELHMLLNEGTATYSSSKMQVIVHGDKTTGNLNQYPADPTIVGDEEVVDCDTWQVYWQYLISRCLNGLDNHGISANVDALAQFLNDNVSDENNPIIGQLYKGVGTNYGTKPISSPRPIAINFWATAMAYILLEMRGTNVEGNLGSFAGDVTQGGEPIKLFDGDKIYWWFRMTSQSPCVGAIILEQDDSQRLGGGAPHLVQQPN